uniref:Sm domain-containing protein n=1 Tax=Panagrolaimus sp. PS1159 TaxID=55785 RepID=A0AC35G1X1_9BILA
MYARQQSSTSNNENSKPIVQRGTSNLSLEQRQALLSRLANPDGPRNIQKRVRERTLAAICINGFTPITKEKPVMEFVDPIGRKITEYIKKKTLVTIKLRNRNHFEIPNRTIMGIILAADHHWNLLITEADEAYIPACRLGVIQSYPDQMFKSTVYDRVEGQKRLLQRSLESTIIMGHNIVYISAVPEK